jgi:hypothetical protein
VTRALQVVAVVLALARGVVAGHHECHEHSAIVGRELCSRFGDGWTHQWIDDVEIGIVTPALFVEHLAVPALNTTEAAYNATGPANYHLAVAGHQRMWAVGGRTGVRWHARHAIAGLEAAWAVPVESPSALSTLDGYGPISTGSAIVFEPAVYSGAHWRFAQLDVSALAVAGVRSLSYVPELPNGYSACLGGTTQAKGCYVFVNDHYPFAGVRAGADVWITRFVTLGVSAGVDLTDRAESFALEFHLHSAPYDGA